MSRSWVGVASREHVWEAVRKNAVQQLTPGDHIVYYSPRERMREGAAVQAFTPVGEISDGDVRQDDKEAGFQPYRRNVRYLELEAALIRPLLPKLSFTKEQSSWGQVFRGGSVEITAADHELIVQTMRNLS